VASLRLCVTACIQIGADFNTVLILCEPRTGFEENALLRIDVARSAAELDRLRPAWERLYTPGRHTVFQSFAWNRLAAQHFAGRHAPLVVFAESASSLALIPACVADQARITLLGDVLFDYRAILQAGGSDALDAAFSYLADLHLPLDVTAVREQDVLPFRDFEPEFFCNAPGVQRQTFTAEQFAAEHSRLGRFFRRLAKQRVELQQFFGDQESLIRWIYQRKGEQFVGSAVDIFSDPARIDFMVRAAAIDPAKFEIFAFTSAAGVIAALVTLRDDHVRRFYTVWFDQAWAQYSPGTVLVFAITERSLAEGLDCDYMTGEQHHKIRFATSMTRLFRVAGHLRPALTVEEQPGELASVETLPLPAAD
jgi:CelD/BcsL family acetyltransferase involved in cellulose biosynthesis